MLRRLAKLDSSWIPEAEARRIAGIIDAMTPEERKTTYLIDIPRRRRRVALGAGVEPSEVLRAVEQFDTMDAFIKQHGSMSLIERLRLFFRELRRETVLLLGNRR